MDLITAHHTVQNKVRVRDTVWIKVRCVIVISQMRSQRPRGISNRPESRGTGEGEEHEGTALWDGAGCFV